MTLSLNFDAKCDLIELPVFVPNDDLFQNHAAKLATEGIVMVLRENPGHDDAVVFHFKVDDVSWVMERQVNRPTEAAPHTLANIQETEFYSVNHIHSGIFEKAHQTSAKYPEHISEFDAVGLTPLFRLGILAPFVEESNIQYLLKLEEVIPIKLNGTFLVVGSLQQAFIQENVMDEDGYLSIEKANSLCSLGINGYYETKFLDKLPYAKA
jgi:flavin reductase (DIM6/NTAB) family NADH-FMN oxidoreductase RutF